MGLTLLTHASMPINFWDHSFIIVDYLINRLPTSVLLDYNSPYQAVFNKKIEYGLIKTFGCAFFALIRPYIAKSHEGFFLVT